MRAMVGDARGEFAEVRHHQNHYALPDETLVGLPRTPVGKEIRGGRGAIELRLADDQRKITTTHLPMRKSFAQSKPRCQLVGGQSEHNYAGTRTVLKQSAQSEVPIPIMGLLHREAAHFVLRTQIRTQ